MTETKAQQECPYCHGSDQNKITVNDVAFGNKVYKVGSEPIISAPTIVGGVDIYVGINGYIVLDAHDDVYSEIESAVACPVCGRKLEDNK
ncbi:hypothetical protein [Lactobacillus acetotolerans]|uniref:hypothetical protein n=1 Tax=Lactobacillus acetotolerans TaxID=1600 RepID=UPI002FDB171A